MGNRGLLRALQRIDANPKLRAKVRFGQIFLAAPEELAYLFPKFSKRTTLYVSAADKVLDAASRIHGTHRVKFTPPATIVTGVGTVVVKSFDVTTLGG
jgi:hypothetical protein